MAKLTWDGVGKKYFEAGVERGVLYPAVAGAYPAGVAWNGLSAITESPSGAEPTPIYADNIKYLTLMSAEEFGLTIEAYTYPDEWAACDGSVIHSTSEGLMIGQQGRTPFGLCYRTKVGNDADGENHAYKLHLVYGCLASPTEKAFQTINDSPEAATFSWEVTTTPVPVTGFKPTSILTIDSRTASPTALAALEDELYGTVTDPANLPMPDAVIALLGA